MPRIAVIGAGVVGLSTAINIKQSIPGAHVTLVADKFNQYTTSDGAGALIVPWANGIDDATRRKWGEPTLDHFTKLAVSEYSAESGAVLTMGMFYGPNPEPPVYGSSLLTFNPVPRATAERLNLGQYYLFTATTIVVEMRKYLPWLMKRYKELGGDVVERRVQSFDEFVGIHDIVVNCTGMGAKDLTGDDKLMPLRGQTLRISAPWLKHFLHPNNVPGEIYPHLYPNTDSAIMGGVKQPGNTDLSINPETTQKIWDTVTKLWPPIKPAKILWEWAGHRPERGPPRVESEIIRYGDKTLKIVHNYGHGSTGVSLGWGTGLHATELVQKMLAPASKL